MNGFNRSACGWWLLVGLACPAYGETPGVDEEKLFSGDDVMVEKKELDDAEKKSLGLSGEVTGVFSHTDRNAFDSYLLGNWLLDARLPKGYKAFVNLESQANFRTKVTDFTLREFFLDLNLSHAVYFRMGKQVLQWGRGYLWNPADFVNVERKTFIQKIGYREGASGLKMHVPFGTKWNLYGFLDTAGASKTDQIASAVKVEFLLGETETAFSAWGKTGFPSLYGWDISTRLFGWDVAGEVSASYGSHTHRLVESAGTLLIGRTEGEWIPKASVNLTKFFDFDHLSDRISMTFEFFYNHGGYSENLLGDGVTYLFSVPTAVLDASLVPVVKTSGTKGEFLLYNGLYEPNYYAKGYAAMFLTLNKFPTSEMALGLSVIGNLVDRTCIVSPSLSYADIHDVRGSVTVSVYGGAKGEYTYLENLMTTRVTAGVVF